MHKETIGRATLYLGDAREVLPRLRHADALITDPPYGVGFKRKTTKHTNKIVDFPYRDDEASFRDVEPRYFEIACRRIEAAQQRGRMAA